MSTVLSVQNLKKEYGERVLFSGISFEVADNERLAIVGPNGCGKSTMLNIIAGETDATDGLALLVKDCSMGYLAQYQEDEPDFANIHEYVLSVRQDILDMEARLKELEWQMDASGGELDRVMDEYHTLSHTYDAAGGTSYRSEAVGVLKGLGFLDGDLTKSMNELSGGQKTRVNLARLLLKKPDVLLLDEPVNHLDMASIEWLEGFLANYRHAVVVVAHDRYFLDKVATDVLDLGSSVRRLYHGNYSSFVEQKSVLVKSYERAYEKQQKEIAHQEEVIKKLKQFNREKSIRRAESREKKLARLEKMDAPEAERQNMRLTLTPERESGKDVLQVEGLAKSFDGRRLFSDLDFRVQRGERVALIGENGCGKTTILKIINEVLPPDAGLVRIGTGVSIAYFDQEQQNLDESKTLYDELSDAYANLTETKIRNVLAAFLFQADDAYKRISELSGGERGRISLCKLMLSGANFLILDEPTNHLDMESKEILGQTLLSYTGTVLYVSHDRYFINQTAERILELSAAHGLREFLGDYDYYQRKRGELASAAVSAAKKQAAGGAVSGKAASGSGAEVSVNGAADDGTASGNGAVNDEAAAVVSGKDAWKKQKEEAAKQRKRENERKRIEEEIEALETESEGIDEAFLDEATAKNSAKLNELTSRQDEIKRQLEELYERWDELV